MADVAELVNAAIGPSDWSDPVEEHEFKAAFDAVCDNFGDRYSDQYLSEIAEHLVGYSEHDPEYDDDGSVSNVYVSFSRTPQEALLDMRRQSWKLALRWASTKHGARVAAIANT